MKEFVYVIAIINFLIKIALTISLDINFAKEKKKKRLVQIESSRKTIVNRPENSNENFSNQDKMRKSVGAFFQGGKNPFAKN
jgi:hypothetical protein